MRQVRLSAGHTVRVLFGADGAREEGAVSTATRERKEEEASVSFFSSGLG